MTKEHEGEGRGVSSVAKQTCGQNGLADKEVATTRAISIPNTTLARNNDDVGSTRADTELSSPIYMVYEKILQRISSNRGVLGSVSIGLYRYGQLKPNILVCEILNRNRPKWLENHRFRCISVSVDFGRFSVFQREGY